MGLAANDIQNKNVTASPKLGNTASLVFTRFFFLNPRSLLYPIPAMQKKPIAPDLRPCKKFNPPTFLNPFSSLQGSVIGATVKFLFFFNSGSVEEYLGKNKLPLQKDIYTYIISEGVMLLVSI